MRHVAVLKIGDDSLQVLAKLKEFRKKAGPRVRFPIEEAEKGSDRAIELCTLAGLTTKDCPQQPVVVVLNNDQLVVDVWVAPKDHELLLAVCSAIYEPDDYQDE